MKYLKSLMICTVLISLLSCVTPSYEKPEFDPELPELEKYENPGHMDHEEETVEVEYYKIRNALLKGKAYDSLFETSQHIISQLKRALVSAHEYRLKYQEEFKKKKALTAVALVEGGLIAILTIFLIFK